MGMDIDPAGRRQQAAGVDLAPPRARLAADADNDAAVNREVAVARGRPGAVHDGCVSDYEIMHRLVLP